MLSDNYLHSAEQYSFSWPLSFGFQISRLTWTRNSGFGPLLLLLAWPLLQARGKETNGVFLHNKILSRSLVYSKPPPQGWGRGGGSAIGGAEIGIFCSDCWRRRRRRQHVRIEEDDVAGRFFETLRRGEVIFPTCIPVEKAFGKMNYKYRRSQYIFPSTPLIFCLHHPHFIPDGNKTWPEVISLFEICTNAL